MCWYTTQQESTARRPPQWLLVPQRETPNCLTRATAGLILRVSETFSTQGSKGTVLHQDVTRTAPGPSRQSLFRCSVRVLLLELDRTSLHQQLGIGRSISK